MLTTRWGWDSIAKLTHFLAMSEDLELSSDDDEKPLLLDLNPFDDASNASCIAGCKRAASCEWPLEDSARMALPATDAPTRKMARTSLGSAAKSGDSHIISDAVHNTTCACELLELGVDKFPIDAGAQGNTGQCFKAGNQPPQSASATLLSLLSDAAEG